MAARSWSGSKRNLEEHGAGRGIERVELLSELALDVG
jgi:hypothetical protein